MSDPWRIFRNDPSRAETLKILWPELYNSLADLDSGKPAQAIRCCLSPCAHLPITARPVAVGRIFDNGHPACAEHITLANRPGGWPLKVERKARAR
jgi:hypothetical protein